MSSTVFGVELEATLEDGSKITKGSAWVIDNKRVYKTEDGTELVGAKAVKSIDSWVVVVHPLRLRKIMRTYEVKT